MSEAIILDDGLKVAAMEHTSVSPPNASPPNANAQPLVISLLSDRVDRMSAVIRSVVRVHTEGDLQMHAEFALQVHFDLITSMENALSRRLRQDWPAGVSGAGGTSVHLTSLLEAEADLERQGIVPVWRSPAFANLTRASRRLSEWSLREHARDNDGKHAHPLNLLRFYLPKLSWLADVERLLLLDDDICVNAHLGRILRHGHAILDAQVAMKTEMATPRERPQLAVASCQMHAFDQTAGLFHVRTANYLAAIHLFLGLGTPTADSNRRTPVTEGWHALREVWHPSSQSCTSAFLGGRPWEARPLETTRRGTLASLSWTCVAGGRSMPRPPLRVGLKPTLRSPSSRAPPSRLAWALRILHWRDRSRAGQVSTEEELEPWRAAARASHSLCSQFQRSSPCVGRGRCSRRFGLPARCRPASKRDQRADDADHCSLPLFRRVKARYRGSGAVFACADMVGAGAASPHADRLQSAFILIPSPKPASLAPRTITTAVSKPEVSRDLTTTTFDPTTIAPATITRIAVASVAASDRCVSSAGCAI